MVTYPAPAPAAGHPVSVGRTRGRAGDGVVGWPLGAGYARVRGDLTEDLLVRVAAGTRVVAGRPVVQPPSGLVVVASAPLRPADVREARYASASLGEGAALGDGLTYTGVVRCGGLEEALYTAGFQPDGTVAGPPRAAAWWAPGPGAPPGR